MKKENDTIKRKLTRAGYTRLQVAERCGVTPSTVDNWLSRGRPIPADKMRMLQDMLKGTRDASPLEQVLAFNFRLTPAEYDRLRERAGIDFEREVEGIVRDLMEERWGIISGNLPDGK